jgi:hypothetical protein
MQINGEELPYIVSIPWRGAFRLDMQKARFSAALPIVPLSEVNRKGAIGKSSVAAGLACPIKEHLHDTAHAYRWLSMSYQCGEGFSLSARHRATTARLPGGSEQAAARASLLVKHSATPRAELGKPCPLTRPHAKLYIASILA